jgi:hypothetical protein
MERAGKRNFSDYCPAEKACIFQQWSFAKYARDEMIPEKESRKGVIAKINANNLCQRKLF